LTEAEFVARDAIRNVELPAALKYANWPVPLNGLKKIHGISEYSGINAGPFAMLALIFMEQGRLEDALYLAHIAKNMHEVGCSEPESLGYNRIRSIFIRILAQQEDWVGVLQQIHEIRDSLIDHPELFQRYFGDTLDVAEAEINAGTATLGQSILELRLQILGEQEDQTPVDAYERAVIQGLRALAMSRQGQQLKALSLYSDAFSDLVQIMPIRNDSNLEGRRKRIIYGYKQELHRLYQSGARMVQGLNISDELFKLVNATQTSRVQNALAATRVRTTTVDPGLSAVIRQLQGLEQEAFSITETLARISYSDNFDTSQISPIRFKQRLQAIKLASHALREEIENRFPQYAELTQPHPLSIEEAAAYINSKQALLFYHNEANYGYFWMVLPDNETHFRILDLSKQVIERQVQALRNSVDPQFVEKIGDIPKFDIDVAHLLYKELLEPVEEELNDVEELMVVPGASLGTLPFSLLVTETTELGEDIRLLFDQYRKVSWLARKYSIVQLPTVNSLREISLLSTQKNEKKRKNYAGFADPYFHSDHTQNEGIQLTDVRGANTLLRGLVSKKSRSTSNVSKIDVSILPRLPDTRDEVLSIADALDADPGKDIFVGRRASEANVKNIDLSTYRVISFATHGLIPGDLNGLHEPALAFTNPEISGDSENDGVLTATEILGLKLSADIVVLSACNTAAGDGQGLEAVSGLGRSFFFAGARSVLVSNWPVHSAATTSLMSRLFIAIANNPEISRSQNLRLTQLQMIDKLGYEENGHLVFSYAHPIFWAPFTLVGDGG
jgi:CHAT domain-containing protein